MQWKKNVASKYKKANKKMFSFFSFYFFFISVPSFFFSLGIMTHKVHIIPSQKVVSFLPLWFQLKCNPWLVPPNQTQTFLQAYDVVAAVAAKWTNTIDAFPRSTIKFKTHILIIVLNNFQKVSRQFHACDLSNTHKSLPSYWVWLVHNTTQTCSFGLSHAKWLVCFLFDYSPFLSF